MKYKIIDSGYNEKTGVSYVIIQSPKGIFLGYSHLHDEDKQWASKYAGCQYAESKAVIKMITAEIKEKKLLCDTFDSFYKELNQSKKFAKDGYTSNKLLEKRKKLRSEYNELIDLRDSIQKNLLNAMEERPKKASEFYNAVQKIKKNRSLVKGN